MLAGLGRSGRPTSKMERPEKKPVLWLDKKNQRQSSDRSHPHAHLYLRDVEARIKSEEYFIHNEFRGWVVILDASFRERFPLLSKN